MGMTGTFRPSEVPKMCVDNMQSDAKAEASARMRRECMEEIQTDWELKHSISEVRGMIPCTKCSSMKTTYTQMQIDCGDEPMMTFLTCLSCGNRWKFDDQH